ncbi:MAG TPA: hypothetical protein V6C97_36050 [Oculatellaceae cyanobacterium]
MGTVCGAPFFWWFETNKLFVLLEVFPVPWKLHIEGELCYVLIIVFALGVASDLINQGEAALANN